MTQSYGDMFPLGDRLPHPDSYTSPEDLSLMALVSAETLAAGEPLNYGAVEMHMRGLVGLFNGYGSLDDATYNRMSPAARAASREAADASYGYLTGVGLQEEVLSDLDYFYPDGYSDRERDSSLLNAMQRHVLLVGPQEEDIRRAELYRSMARTSLPEAPSAALPKGRLAQERLTSRIPYSEEGIRSVLRVFGKNFGTVLQSFYEVAPLSIDRRMIVHHATGSLVAATPRT